MQRFLSDTSCMIAAMCAWHEHHERAAREIELRLTRNEVMVVAAPALVEAYAVLTRLPPPHRLSPATSLALLQANFMNDTVEEVALGADAYHRLLQAAPDQDIAGGSIYDAVVFACGLAAGADALLTFNERQFRRFDSQRLEVIVPP